MNRNIQSYQAPDGYVYDFAEPKYHTEINADGEEIEVEIHLYAKYLFLSKYDNINNYKLVEDVRTT